MGTANKNPVWCGSIFPRTCTSSSSELESRNIPVLLFCCSLHPILSTYRLWSCWDWGGTCQHVYWHVIIWALQLGFSKCVCRVGLTYKHASMYNVWIILCVCVFINVCECWCKWTHHPDSPGPQSKGLWYVWVDHDCWTEQSRERSAPEIRQASSFDGDHRLLRAVKLLRLKEKKDSNWGEEDGERDGKCVVTLKYSVCSLLERLESNMWCSLLL